VHSNLITRITNAYPAFNVVLQNSVVWLSGYVVTSVMYFMTVTSCDAGLCKAQPCGCNLNLKGVRNPVWINYKFVWFEVLMAVTKKSTICYDMTPCNLVEVCRHFGATYCIHLQSWRISQAWIQLTLLSWTLLKKLPVVQLFKNSPTFYGTRRFIAVFTRAIHWSLSWASSNQSTPFHSL
jgi:hypothetical protein